MPGGWEWLIIIVVLVLLFGAKRLPDMARSVGQSARVFKGEMKGMRDEDGRTAPPDRATPPARAAELPPATGSQHTGPQHTGQPYTGQPYADRPQDGPVTGDAAGAPATEPVRRDADR